MCVVSMVMQHYDDEWSRRLREWQDMQRWQWPYATPPNPIPSPVVTPQEVAEFHRLLERAREYDRKHGEPDCELESKKQKVRELAEQLGVEVNFV